MSTRSLVCLALGGLAPLLLDVVPTGAYAYCLAAAGCGFLLPRRPSGLMSALLAAAWTLWHIQAGLAVRAQAQMEEARLSGRVVSLPQVRGDQQEFVLRTARPLAGMPAGSLVQVRWYRAGHQVQAGQTWAFVARLKPPAGRLNLEGPDPERSLFAARIAGLAVVRHAVGKVQPLRGSWRGLTSWRDRARARLNLQLANRPGTGLVTALAIADRQGLSSGFRDAVATTGTGHLLAISGMHVGLVALFGYGLARWLAGPLLALAGAGSAHLTALTVALAGAVAYSALAGFGTSTQRALIMLGLPLAAAFLRRNVRPWRVWLLALVAVLVANPLTPLQGGFWLSFMAVAVLLAVFRPRTGAVGRTRALILAQLGITLVMAPLGMRLFNRVALGGLAVNVLAIPWVGMVTLPLTLVGTGLLTLHTAWAEAALSMAAQSGLWATEFISAAADWLTPLHLPTPRPGLWMASAAAIGAFAILMPRGHGLRWLGCALCLPLLASSPRAPGSGEAELELLDVGQGLAALVRTRGHLLLYDTGPGMPGAWDLVHSVLDPALARHGRRAANRTVISHGDLDHAGGLTRLRARFPDTRFLVSLPGRGASLPACRAGVTWAWDGVRFEVLHPSGFLPYLGNDSSCVLGIRLADSSILLPGDIGEHVETRLQATSQGDYRILIAPHHGSRGSTSQELLDWARPQIALIAAGAGNRFGFPHAEMLGRLQARNIPAWSTSRCGGLRLQLEVGSPVKAWSARRARPAFWRRPAGPECP